MRQEDRYMSKLERFFREEEFIIAHRTEIKDEVTERALLYSLQVAVEISMDIIAMKIRDMGLKVEDDAANIERITREGIILANEADFLREMTGIRNIIFHRYNHLDMGVISEALSRISELKSIIIKISEY